MVPDDDWYAELVDGDPESAEESIRTMPLYDEEGVEIPDDELPWNNVTGMRGAPPALWAA